MVENKYISSIWVRYYRFGSSDYKAIHTIPIVRCEKTAKNRPQTETGFNI